VRNAVIVLALLVTACASTGPPPADDLVAEFVATFNRLDAAAMGALFAEDATAFLPLPNAAAKLTGRTAIVATLEPLFAAERARSGSLNLTPKDLSMQRSGNTAIATFDVGTADVHSRRTLVLEARRGRWVIVHLHASNVRPN
jgi:uncharacterized protein (TIGR02246 family)